MDNLKIEINILINTFNQSYICAMKGNFNGSLLHDMSIRNTLKRLKPHISTYSSIFKKCPNLIHKFKNDILEMKLLMTSYMKFFKDTIPIHKSVNGGIVEYIDSVIIQLRCYEVYYM